MMKTLYKYSVIAALLMSFSMASCSREEENIFDDSAAQRTEAAKKKYAEILCDKGGKWQLEYFTTDAEPGYIYLLTFDKNGSVKMSCANKYAAMVDDPTAKSPAFKSETSLWEIIADNGPVLSFNSYNKYFHLFSDPEDIPDTERDEQGYGHDGDYEFTLMSYANDTLKIEGKKNNVKMIMTRVAADYDDETYMNEVVALTDSFFNAKIPTVYVNLPGGYRHVILNGATQILTFYPETGDYITENDSRNAIITHNGLTLGSPISLTDSINGQKYAIQHFVRQADGALLCTDNPQISITADNFNKVFVDKDLTWKVNASASAGEMKSYYDACVAEMKSVSKYTLQSMTFKSAGDKEDPSKYALGLGIRTSAGKTLNVMLYYTVAIEGTDRVTFTFDGTGDKNGETIYKKFATLQALVGCFNGKSVTITSSSRLAPVRMMLTAAEGDYLTVDVQ